MSINNPDQHVDQYSVDITLTLDQHVAQDFINTRPTFSPKLAKCQSTHINWLTLDGVSVKISGLLTDCRLRCRSGVDLVLIEISIKDINQYSTVDTLSTDDPNECTTLNKVCHSSSSFFLMAWDPFILLTFLLTNNV